MGRCVLAYQVNLDDGLERIRARCLYRREEVARRACYHKVQPAYRIGMMPNRKSLVRPLVRLSRLYTM